MPATDDTRYNMKLLHKVFALSSIVLLLATVWMFVADHRREWKTIQRTHDRIDMKMTKWRQLQTLSEGVSGERERLQQGLSEARSRELSPELVDRFCDEVRSDASRRQAEPPAFARLESLLRQLNEASQQAERDRKAWRQARLATDRARLAAEDAAVRAADAAGPETESLREKARELREASRGAAAREKEALATRLASESAVAPLRDDTMAALQVYVDAARFREQEWSRSRRFASSELDALKAEFGMAVRSGESDEELRRRQAEIDRRSELIRRQTEALEAATEHREQLQSLVKQMTESERVLQKRLNENIAQSGRLEERLQEKRSTYFTFYGFLPLPGKKWLELPILDAFNSPRRIDNLWSEGLVQPAGSFGNVRRFDRCTTCHEAAPESLPGTPGQSAFPEAEVLELAMSLPEQSGNADSEGDGPPEDVDGTLFDLFGIQLAQDGLLRRNDVTVKYVRPRSAATKARLWRSTRGEIRAGDLRADFLTSDEEAGHDLPLAGLRIGDVIVAVNGEPVPREADSRLWVARRLVDAGTAVPPGPAGAADPRTPVRLSIRRGLPQPFASHPRLDLFVSSISPHPMTEFGCTICHEGQGSGTSFEWSSHTPNDPATRRQWCEQYGWFRNPDWEFPMYPRRFVESGCLKCHHRVLDLGRSERFHDAPAPKVVEGYRLILSLGCFGCHEINGFDGEGRPVGPDLRVEPDYQAAALQFKGAPGTGYDQLNAEEREWIEQLISRPDDDAVRHRIHTMLVEDARKVQPSSISTVLAATLEGQATGGSDAGDQPRFSPYVHDVLTPLLKDVTVPGTLRKVGPSLRFVGRKLEAAYLFDWIRNPTGIRPATRMPRAFGLWDHLPARQLRDQQTLLEQELTDLRRAGSSAPADRLAKVERELRAVREDLNKLNEPETRFEPIAIYSMVRYLLSRSQPYAYLEPPPRITALETEQQKAQQIQRGRVAFQERGCLACHNHVDFPDVDRYRDADFTVAGPDLSTIAAKFAPERNPNGWKWLYSWIRQPSRYDVRTTMPDTILEPIEQTDGDGNVVSVTDPVADIVAYLISGDPGDWQPSEDAIVELDSRQRESLKLLTLTYLRDAFSETTAQRYMRQGIPASELASAKGAEVELRIPAGQTETLSEAEMTNRRLSYVARRSFVTYGCYACHDIPGMEDAKPIGPALTQWGRKDPSQLAFGQIVRYLADRADDRGPATAAPTSGGTASGDGRASAHPPLPPYYQEEVQAGSRIGFIFQKLTEPRSYDYRETQNKKYTDRLRMPQFSLTPQQREAIITFVLGLVADPPTHKYLYRPDPRNRAILDGKEVLNKYGCRGCHVMELESWRLAFPPGYYGPQPRQSTYPFVPVPFEQQTLIASEQLDRRDFRTATLRGMPTLSTDGRVTIFDEEEFPIEEFEDDEVELSDLIFSFDPWRPAALDGQPYQVGEGGLEIPAIQIERRRRSYGGALAKYLLPHVVARERETNPNAKGKEAWGWLPPPLIGEGNKVQPEWLHTYLLNPQPIRPAVLMRMPRYNMSPAESTRLVDYFAAVDGAVYPYPYQRQQQEAYLADADAAYAAHLAALQQQGEMAADEAVADRRLADAMRIVTSGSFCVKCHIVGDFQPDGSDRVKAPDLSGVHRRLRHDYVRKWLAKPTALLPYTPMPVNIPYLADAPLLGTTVPQELYHGTSVEQLTALVDLLMNYDKFAQQRSPVTPLVESPAGE